MKKALLLGAAVLVAAQYTNAEVAPSKIDDGQFTCISPDGTIAGSDLLGTVTLVNPQDGTILKRYPESEEDVTSYCLGNGNGISNTGIVLICRDDADVCWWKDGEFHSLGTLVTEGVSNGLNGITPDGNTICGYCGITGLSTDDQLTPMSVPVVWKLQSDGTYSEPIRLPYPERDFSGRVPQYIIATCISDDGRTIAGQMQDYSGSLPQPMVWRLKDDGTWEYEALGGDLLNPDHVVFPKFPEIEPEKPEAENFMSPDGLADYNDAMLNWSSSGYQGEAPNPINYMTDEEKAAYNAAMDKYNEEMAVYTPLKDAFEAVWFPFLESGKSTFFVFNSTSMTPDGKQLMQMELKEIPNPDPNGWFPTVSRLGSAVFNLENGKYKAFGIDQNFRSSQIVANGSVIGSVMDEMLGTQRAAIYTPVDWNSDAAPEFSWLDERVKTWNPAVYEWMTENMCSDLLGYDPDTYEEITIENVWHTGLPTAAPDLSTIVFSQENTFDLESEAMVFGYCLPIGDTSGIGNIGADSSMSVKAMRGGLLELQGVKGVKVYDAQGRLMYDAQGINGSVSTGLKGVCIVRATGMDGDVKTLKVNF